MNSNINTKEKGLNRKRMKVPAPPTSGKKNSIHNPALLFVEPAKNPNAKKEIFIIKLCSDDTISKDDQTNYETKSFKVIEASG